MEEIAWREDQDTDVVRFELVVVLVAARLGGPNETIRTHG